MARVSVFYLMVQGALTLAWWVMLWTVPESRVLFKPAAQPDDALLSFWLADLVCVAAGSALSGLWLLRRDTRAIPAIWFTTGAIVYGALYCVAVTWQTGEAVLASSLMIPAAMATSLIAVRSRMP